MLRLALWILVTASAVTFVMANTHSVYVNVIVRQPVRVRLIFLLMCTFALGAISTILIGLLSRMRVNRRVHETLRAKKQSTASASDDLVAP